MRITDYKKKGVGGGGGGVGGGGGGEEEEKKKKNKKEETIIVRISLLDSCEITPVERGQLQKHFGLTGDLMREDIMLYGLAWLESVSPGTVDSTTVILTEILLLSR